MNDNIQVPSAPRNQTLIVVEGKLEKNSILRILFRCFPEIPIRIENVHIYENDIYDLYHAIEEEYGELWYEDDLEIDVPFIIINPFQIKNICLEVFRLHVDQVACIRKKYEKNRLF